ncbi:MAG TPA: HAD hydrolase family protein [Clostridia bacterium]|nr:HAD hydrolase family protein [Clostridia bacterium]HPQ48142.1 HAD hydrolase family protein [Clostridia bacterium]
MKRNFDLVAFDLDGTLTQHKTQLEKSSREVLDKLGTQYKLLIIGAGSCRRIHRQMEHYPIDIIGHYGMQCSVYNRDSGVLEIVEDHKSPVNREEVTEKITDLRNTLGYEKYHGDTVEFHNSGMITFPLLGTHAPGSEKLAFDPAREKRRKIYPFVKKVFPGYTVFIGGSSSFDIVPFPYNKRYALEAYCVQQNISLKRVIYVGDDFGMGGNDEDISKSGIEYINVDDYRLLSQYVRGLLI